MTRPTFPRRALRVALFLAAALAGCSSLPVITPDLSPVDPTAIQFQTASGRIVSPERSREIVARLASGGGDSDVMARHLALEQAVSETPLSLGNRVTLLENGPSTYAAMFDAIASARDSINMETYILEGDSTGQRFADALLAKQAQGVQVNLIHDGVGTISTPPEFFKAAGRRRRQRRRVQPRQSAQGQGRLGREPARPQEAPRRRRAARGDGRHQHQQRLLEPRQRRRIGTERLARRWPGQDARRRGAALARHRPPDRRAGGRVVPEALHRHLGRPEGRAARQARLLPGALAAGRRGRARDRRQPRRAVQPDLRDAHLGSQQRRERDPAHQRVTSFPTRSSSRR